MATGTKWHDKPALLLLFALVVVLGAATAITAYANRRGMNVERAELRGDGRVVLVLRPSVVFGADRVRLVEVDPATGAPGAIVDDVGQFGHDLRVFGPAGGHYWFASDPVTLWSRPLDAIDTRVDHPFEGHPELGGGFEAEWRTPGGLIVKGRAGGEYLVSGGGQITASDWTMNAIRWMDWRADADVYPRWKVSLHLPDGREIDSDRVPLESGGLVAHNDGSFVLVDDGSAAIAVGGDLSVPQGRPRVDRIAAIGPDGVRWTASTADWFGEPEHWDLWMEWLSIRVLDVQARGDDVIVVLRASDNDGSDELRFVTARGATGEVVQARSLGAL